MAAHISHSDAKITHNFGPARRSNRRDLEGNETATRLLRKAKKPKSQDIKKAEQTDDRTKGVPNAADYHAFADMTAVPTPIPRSQARSSMTKTSVGTAASMSRKSSLSPKATASIFMPLPPLLSVSNTLPPLVSLDVSAPSVPVSDSRATGTSSAAQTQHTNSHALPAALIALLVIGCSFAVIGMLIVYRAWSRPQRRVHPIPSLPVLIDEFPDRFAADGSPIFGGKERFSPLRPSNAGWDWYQYQPPLIPETAPASNQNVSLPQVNTPANARIAPEKVVEQDFKATPVQTLPYFPTRGRSVDQQSQSAVTRAISRLSTTSLSLYPNSPLLDQDIGIAVPGSPSLTADGHPILQRTKSKEALRRDRLSLGAHDTGSARYSTALAYNLGSPMSISQSIPAISGAATVGRSRIKSSHYAPGAYPRVSKAGAAPSLPLPLLPTPKGLGVANPIKDMDYAVDSYQDAGCRRHRENQALASALGLASPDIELPSLQPTMYPGDSLSRRPLSRIGTSGSRMNFSKPYASPQIMSPSIEVTSTLGNLMLVDFGTSNTITSLTTHNEETSSASTSSIAGQAPAPPKVKRMDDKPPRVPSPPPLPSLAQMGLAHANPELYASYRSPTYSIYGLYQADRKSRATSYSGQQ